MAVGDEKRGLEIIKDASSNTFAVIGGIAGPGGAIAGKVIGDDIVTKIDSAVNGGFRPHGVMRIGPDSSAGDIFDNVMDTMPLPKIRR